MNLQKKIYEVDEIKKVIDFMKYEKSIVDITESNGISTIFSDTLVLLTSFWQTLLKPKQIITIGNINYDVLSIDYATKSFTIEAVGLFSFVSSVKVLAFDKWSLAINFKDGSRTEINEVLANAAKDETKNLTRFPLIWLFINNKQEKNVDDNIDIHTTLDFSFVHLTKKEYRTEQRREKVFKPVIEPLLDLFIQTIESQYFSKVFHFNTYFYNYPKWFRYFYGSSDKNVQVFDAPTDAIEISLDLNFRKQY